MDTQEHGDALDAIALEDWQERAERLARHFGLEEIRIRWTVGQATAGGHNPAMIDLPLWLDGRQVGALVIVSSDGRDFTGGDPAAMRRLLLLREALERELAEHS
ncbi:MAG: hypothetical protein Kow0062_03230 [Acidobacteriota bacterium]